LIVAQCPCKNRWIISTKPALLSIKLFEPLMESSSAQVGVLGASDGKFTVSSSSCTRGSKPAARDLVFSGNAQRKISPLL
jgi:hypothetical protein